MPCGPMILVFATTIVAFSPSEGWNAEDGLVWRTVARAGLIVVGDISVVAETAASGASDPYHDGYKALHVNVEQTIKGKPQRSVRVLWYSSGDGARVTRDRIMAFKGKKAVLFLSQDAKGRCFLSEDAKTSLAPPVSEFVDRICREVRAQSEAIKTITRHFPTQTDEMYLKVKGFVDATTSRETQAAAIRGLTALGFDAVPAMIALMDDPRRLPKREIVLQNHSSGRFEDVRRYSPEIVTDAMAAILNHVTGEDFGSIYNGATERERREAVDGWRVYLYHLKRNANWQKTERQE